MTPQARGWTVALAGTGINLALGVLYAWSIFKGEIVKSLCVPTETTTCNAGTFAWDLGQIQDPYAVCCLMFAVAMIFAGRLQDKTGPKVTAFIGGLLVGSGLILLSQTTDYLLWVVGFGVLVGSGMGFGYSSATPPAVKWFPPSKTGMVVGIVVSGFGLAPVYIAPLGDYLLRTYGLNHAMLLLGGGFTVIVCGLSMVLTNPPAGYSPVAAAPPGAGGAAAPAPTAAINLTPSDMLKTYNFYILWLAFFIGSGAGLMVIGSIAPMAKKSMGDMAFFAVALLAVGNAVGRIAAGSMSDKLGRTQTLFILMLFQAVLMFAASQLIENPAYNSNAVIIVSLATFIGFNYGSNLALFPSLTKDVGGLKNFGANYGAIFTAWGLGAVAVVMGMERIKQAFGGYSIPFIILGGALVVSALLVLTLKKPKAN